MPKSKTVHGIENRKVVSQSEWLVTRKKLLVKEKKFSKLRDELNLQRRNLPWVKIEKEYVSDGPTGKVTLGDLFCGKSQLIIYHFMFGPGWKEGCEHCSFLGPTISTGALDSDTAFAVVSRAPFKKRMGGRFNWVSSFNTDSTLISTCRSRPSRSRAGCCLTITASTKLNLMKKEASARFTATRTATFTTPTRLTNAGLT
jgi:predicted dithiol-disulfide oxidoreductase (DUF899 family)